MPILDTRDGDAVAKYDEFMRTSPWRTVTQDRAWAQVKWDWGHEAVYVEREGRIVAAMSLLVKGLPFGNALLYAPRGPVCDPGDGEMLRALVEEAAPVARKYGAFALKMDPEVPWGEALEKSLLEAGFQVRNRGVQKDALIQPRYNMILKLSGYDEETIMERFSGKTRNRIRGGLKKGLEAEWGRSDDHLRRFYEIYLYMTRRNRLTPRSWEYFIKMRDAFPQLRVYISRHEGEDLSAGITINYFGKLYYLYAGSNDQKRNLGPNQFLNYEMIRWGLSEGAEQYDFGGVLAPDKSDGLYEFKIGFCDKDGMTEYIGEIDKVYKPLVYYAFTHLLPRLQRLRIWLTLAGSKKSGEKKD